TVAPSSSSKLTGISVQ
ncbi:TPA: colicin release lysis protein, partial [Escherichia coli]|nr:colicin release lysis protein [Escherichia coli]